MNGRTVWCAAMGRSLAFGSLEDGLVARPVLQFINERGSSSCLVARRLQRSAKRCADSTKHYPVMAKQNR